MRKMDKKIENQIRRVLTEVCDEALEKFRGFQWLTHLVNYANFPKSIKIICVFDTNDNLTTFMKEKRCHELNNIIQLKLLEIDINFKDITKHISYDSEEDCQKNHNGKWAERLE
jgi:hypothetical protein